MNKEVQNKNKIIETIHKIISLEKVLDEKELKDILNVVENEKNNANGFIEKTLLWGLLEICSKRMHLSLFRFKEIHIDNDFYDQLTKEIYPQSVKGNTEFLKFFKEKISDLEESERKEIYAFISFCVFCTRQEFDLKREYDNQINAAILNKLYFDSLNFQPKWTYGDKTFEPSLISKSDFLKMNILETCISVEDALIWTNLNYLTSPPMEEGSISCFPDYPEKMPSIEKAFSLLLKMSFEEEYKSKSDKEKAEISDYILKQLHHIWLGNAEKPPKPMALEFYELYPGYVYCLYKMIQYLDKNTFNYYFPKTYKGNLQLEKLRFTAMWALGAEKDERIPDPLLYELYMAIGNFDTDEKTEEALRKMINSYGSSPEIQKSMEQFNFEKNYLLRCTFYFLLWDLSAAWHEFIPNESFTENLGYNEHRVLMSQFFEPFLDKTWCRIFTEEERNNQIRLSVKWMSNEVFLKLINLMLEKYHCNGKLESFDLEKTDTEIFRCLLFNLSKNSTFDRNNLLSVMDFVGELRAKKDFFSQPKKSKKYSSENLSNEEIERIRENQRLLREEIDKGFELNHIRQYIPAVPVAGFFYERKMTCKFFNDTDKLYELKAFPEKKKWKIDCKEEYRISRKNNFTGHYLYCAERNTDRHYSRLSALEAVLNDDYPENLLFSFIDARDFLYQQKEEKKGRHNELIQIDYLLKCLEIFVFVFVCKFKLIDKKRLEQESVWNLLFTNDKKALKIKLPDNINFKEVLGEQYLFDIEWFFEFMFCVKPGFIESYNKEISAYLIYLSIRMGQIDTSEK